MKPFVFINIDIETDGPYPGKHSMLSIGAEARNEEHQIIGTFYGVMERLPGASADPETTGWWLAQERDIYEAARKDPQMPMIVMRNFVKWVNDMGGIPVACMAPVGFDWPWVYYYLGHFAGTNPFDFRTLDGKTMASFALHGEYRYIHGRDMPKEWINQDLPHTHHALQDAQQQGELFAKIWKRLKERFAKEPAHE